MEGKDGGPTLGASPPSTPPLQILDGSQGEGGGQILRNAMSYACIFQQGIRITKIRAKRRKPGLKAQHLTGIQLCSEIGGGNLQGGELNSLEIIYHPPPNQPPEVPLKPEYTGSINTAGSICLLLQAALPCVLFAPHSTSTGTTKLILKGGTNADMAPQYDYWERVFLPTLTRCFQWPTNNNNNLIIQPTVLKRGYFPKGGGHVEIGCFLNAGTTITPIQAFQMTDPGVVRHIQIRSFHAGKLPKHLATQMAKSAQNYLVENLDLKNKLNDVSIDTEIVEETNAIGSGLGILLVATTSTNCLLGGSTLCKPKQKAKDAAITAAKELVRAIQQGGCVDEFLQDQLILYMALAEGTSTMLTGCLTLHTQTAIDIAKQLVPGVQFNIEKLDDGDCNGGDDTNITTNDDYGQEGLIPGRHRITCKGIGYRAAQARSE